MKKLRAKLQKPSFPHPEDLERMRKLLWSKGYDAELVEIQRAWIDFSQSTCGVSWVAPHVLRDETLLKRLLEHMEER